MVRYRRTEESVRFCLTQFDTDATQTDKKTLNGVYGTGVKFSGALSEPLNWMNQIAFGHELFNYTSVVKRSFGRYNESSGLFNEDSCMYSVQRNESDVGLVYVQMTFMANAHGLRIIPPHFRQYNAILSKYNITDSFRIPDVFENFRTAFDRYIWAALALFVLAFIVLVKIQIRMENKRAKKRRLREMSQIWKKLGEKLNVRLQSDPRARSMLSPVLASERPKSLTQRLRAIPPLKLLKDNAIYDVLTHLSQVETVDYDVLFLRVIFFFITILSFYILMFFGNLMSTDMVLAEEPQIIRSYKDLLDKEKLQMVFLEIQDDYMEFEYAPPGSIKRKLWDRSMESVNGKRDDLFIKMGSDSGLASSAVSSISKTVSVDEKNRIELVAVFSSTIVSAARATACSAKAAFAYRNSKNGEQFARMFKSLETIYSWVAKDPDERETLATPFLRQGFRTPLARRMEKRSAYLVEAGTLEYIFDKSLAKTVLFSRPETPDEVDVYRKCMSDDIRENMKKNVVIAMKLNQFKLLVCTCGGILVLGFVVLLYEGWFKS